VFIKVLGGFSLSGIFDGAKFDAHCFILQIEKSKEKSQISKTFLDRFAAQFTFGLTRTRSPQKKGLFWRRGIFFLINLSIFGFGRQNVFLERVED
jgi:hypothetical protein